MRGATESFQIFASLDCTFLSTLPARGATNKRRCMHIAAGDFYPRSPRGERRVALRSTRYSCTFLSTLPARGATYIASFLKLSQGAFLSTLPARGATVQTAFGISYVEFLSTLPARGATCVLHHRVGAFFISIHAPREGSDNTGGFQIQSTDISIHAPREGSDIHSVSALKKLLIFLSTLPARGATAVRSILAHSGDISIHAPREGSDPVHLQSGQQRGYFYPRSPRGERRKIQSNSLPNNDFYPRSPRGERQGSVNSMKAAWEFLSTLPAKGATT